MFPLYIRPVLKTYSSRASLIAILVASFVFCWNTSSNGSNRKEKRLILAKNLHLAFSTYLGGSKYDTVRDVATDVQGNIYVTGGTDSPDFLTTSAAFSRKYNGGKMDVFVTKLDPNGQIIWSTYLGGPSYDRAYAIEVDNEGCVYVAGRAGIGFPVTEGSFQTVFQGGKAGKMYPAQDGFVAKLKPDGSGLVWAGYFGANDGTGHIVRDLALDHSGDVYLAAASETGTYPEAVLKAFRKGFQQTPSGRGDGVVAKIRSDGSEVLWATYLGGSGRESEGASIKIDASGNPYFLTSTNSDDIPTTPGAYDRTSNGDWDFYLAKLKADGSGLIYGTYLGGSKFDGGETHNLAIDIRGNAYVVAGTTSPDFPTTSGAFQRDYGGSGGRGTGKRSNYPGDVVVAKISDDGHHLLASTFVGGSLGEAAEGVAVDAHGNVYFTGATFSSNFPVTRNAFQARNGGKADAFAAKLSADFNQLLYSTYMGGLSIDFGRAATITGKGNFILGGEIALPGSGWPIRLPFQKHFGGGNGDGVVAKFTFFSENKAQP
jgi:hypothetical protein